MKALVTILVFHFSTIFAAAQWEEINSGISGALITSIYSHGGTLYFGSTNGTIYVSEDDAKNWTTLSIPGAANGFGVNSIAVIGDALIALVPQSGVFVSYDKGQTWEPSKNGITSSIITSLLVVNEKLFLGTWKGVLVSTDTARTWQASSTNTPGIRVSSMCQSGSDIFLTTVESGIFRTTDLGTTWSATDSNNVGTKYFTYSCSGKGKVYAISIYGDFVTTTNNGQSWVNRPRPSGESFTTIYSDGDLVYGGTSKGFVVSSDDGVTWNPLGQSTLAVNARISGHKSMLVAGPFFGLGCYISTDKGQTWSRSDKGIRNLQISSLARTAGKLLALSDRGSSFVSIDNGNTWDIQSVLSGQLLTSMVIDNTVVAGTDLGVAFSTDACSTWSVLSKGLTNYGCVSLCSLKGNLYVGTIRVIHTSSDNGNTWTPCNTSPQYVRSLYVHNQTIFAGNSQGGIYTSTDEGATWSSVKPSGGNSGILSIAGSSTTLFAASYGSGLYRSENGGKTWEYATSFSDSHPEVITYKSGIWYVGADGAMYTSSDDGESWNQFSDGLDNTNVLTLDVQTDYVYAGTNRGMYRIKQSDISDVESPRSIVTEQSLTCRYSNGTLQVNTSSACSHSQVLRISTITGESVFIAPVVAGVESHSFSISLVPGLYCVQLIGSSSQSVLLSATH